MSYERLTKRTEYGKADVECGNNHARFNAKIVDIINRLADLEDKIENGTLLEFPFVKYQKEDDSWQVWFIDEYGDFDCYTYDNKEEAKERLKELKNDSRN